MKFIPLLLVLLSVFACSKEQVDYSNQRVDVQGHCGARGLFPENSIAGFKAALDLGVSTLDLDVCMTRDAVVVVSKDHWMSAQICTLPNGDRFAKANEKTYNIYELGYHAVQKYDCGSLGHPLFPNQKKVKSYKYSLEKVVTDMDAYAQAIGRPMPHYNIEIRRIRGYDQIFHPEYDFFAQSVMHDIKKLGIEDRSIIQSFDAQTLEYIHDKYANQQVSFLVDSEEGVVENMKKIKFVPKIYSPNFSALNKKDIALLHKWRVKIIPFGVNEIKDMKAMLDLGVDGIITDYPDRLMELVSK